MPFFKIQIPEKGNRFPPVTPLSQRYNNVWVNGGAVPSSEADSRAFSFDGSNNWMSGWTNFDPQNAKY